VYPRFFSWEEYQQCSSSNDKPNSNDGWLHNQIRMNKMLNAELKKTTNWPPKKKKTEIEKDHLYELC
jgi:hypothetical protein